MDKGVLFRSFLVVVAILALSTAGWVALMYSELSSLQLIANKISILFDAHIRPLYEGVFAHVIAIISVAFLLFNYHVVLSFVRRTLATTDALVIGSWYVYRYTKTSLNILLLKDIWTVRRNVYSRYVVDIKPIQRTKRNAYGGKVSYKQRDRFNILLEGTDHEEQSLICFIPRIPTSGDTRMLGFAVGDDADYVLSARPYLASRCELPDDLVQKILDDASKSVKEGSSDQLIQLTRNMSLEILHRNPVPADVIPEEFGQSLNLISKAWRWCVSIWTRAPG